MQIDRENAYLLLVECAVLYAYIVIIIILKLNYKKPMQLIINELTHIITK